MHHRLTRTLQQLLALSLSGALLFGTASFALAADEFSSTWQPTPLVDTNAPSNQPSEASQNAKAPAQPDNQQLEEVLKPAEPFIASVEARLSIKPKAGSPLTRRLNTLQTILYGEQKYQDAGELLAKLAEMFPQEAEKANAALARQMATPPEPSSATANASGRKPGKVMMSRGAAKSTVEALPMAMPAIAQPAGAPQKTPKPKKSFWSSFNDDEDSLFNDPFFKDNDDSDFLGSRSRSQSQSAGPAIVSQASQTQPSDTDRAPRSGGGSLSALGGGLMQLAMLAGSVAGSYYLDKKLGLNNNTGTYNSDGAYVDPYGRLYAPATPYGYPYPQGYAYPNSSANLPGYSYNPGAVRQDLLPGAAYDAYGRRLPTYYNYSGPGVYQPYRPYGQQSLIPSLGSILPTY